MVYWSQEKKKKKIFFHKRDRDGKRDFFIFPLKALWNRLSVYLSVYKWSPFLKQPISPVIMAFVIIASFHGEMILLQELLRQSGAYRHRNTKCHYLLITRESCCTETGVQPHSCKVQTCKKKKKNTQKSLGWDNDCSKMMRYHQFCSYNTDISRENAGFIRIFMVAIPFLPAIQISSV